MKKILLDTNAYSNYLRGDENVLSALSEANIVYMSIFVLGELYSGFKNGTKESWNKENLHSFIKKPTVNIIDATIETSIIFAEIKNSLKISESPIPINDVWIAAHAFEMSSVLITFDSHFKNIPGIRLWDYIR
ncbi:MAG: type II toxin-antitoxin system VapC family toxin [Leptospiraceae bacterium]|nr:type II toxin-antitoxin system VapC family toxin [Leptospiraceae bacterium]MCP5495786.1 type II toxin-antitoxin system VapC family toxin [Leptospiraceae bacterium]